MAEQKRVQEHVRVLNKLFVDCDDDNTGMLTDDELRVFLKGVMALMDEDDLKEHEITHALHFVLAAADKDNDGGIAFAELVPAFEAFNNWTLKADGMREQVRELMGKHDKDESGSLDKEELLILVTELNLGKKVKDDVFEKIWKSADMNDDGDVSIDELAPALSRWDQGDFDLVRKNKYSVRKNDGSDGVEGKGEGGGAGGGGGGGGGGACCLVS